MTDLERQLAALAAKIDVPAPPDLASAVSARIAGRRRAIWPGIAALAGAAALAVALAVPASRGSLLRFFHLRGVSVERVETLPAGRERELGSSLGVSLPLERAEARLGFRLLLPPGVRPRRVRVGDGLGSVVLQRDGRPLLLSEFAATGLEVLKKVAAAGTNVGPVTVGSDRGLWIEGPPHVLLFVTRAGTPGAVPVEVQGDVLLWERGKLTLRLQGRLPRREAIALARSVR